MLWTDMHGRLLGDAFEAVLQKPGQGTVAFVRCLTPTVVAKLAADCSFDPSNWRILRVADSDDPQVRTITADGAVEWRETKGEPVLFLVDTDLAGAGMDGIYSASREVDEATLFKFALRGAASAVTQRWSYQQRQYAERAIRKANRLGSLHSLSPWTKFDFLCQVAAGHRPPGAWVHLLGLWPIANIEGSDADDMLNVSRGFVEQLLGTVASARTIPARMEALNLARPTDQQRVDLERFIRQSDTLPLLHALKRLHDKEHLWLGNLRTDSSEEIEDIKLSPWLNKKGKVYKWSGLRDGDMNRQNSPPELVLVAPGTVGAHSRLEIRWTTKPQNLKKHAVDYMVAVVTDAGDDLAERLVSHSGRKFEKCRFSDDDFSMLSEDSIIPAKIRVSVAGIDRILVQETEEFIIRFGQPIEEENDARGRLVRTFSDALIELPDRSIVSDICENPSGYVSGSKDSVLLRTKIGSLRTNFRVPRPRLVHRVERDWISRGGAVGRWRLRVRISGEWVEQPEFIPFKLGTGRHDVRMVAASRKMAKRFALGEGGVAQVYDDRSKAFEAIESYIRAWTAVIGAGDPLLALCNTVEVQSLSGQTFGLIVLPGHPLRVAWQAAYDNLVLHARYDEDQPSKAVRDELKILDGSLFPAFLPDPNSCQAGASGIDDTTRCSDGRRRTYVFADIFGFHAVGMVGDDDKEPKAAVAVLARALVDGESADTLATAGMQSAKVVGNEIMKYLACHHTSRLLRVHALRAGDGQTVARSLGFVHRENSALADEANMVDSLGEDDLSHRELVFSLDLYPSARQRGVAGRFIADARRKRRSGAGVLSSEDWWMLESLSLPGGIHVPRLRWARKDEEYPATAAHLAVAFDTFESRVVSSGFDSSVSGIIRAFGLMASYNRNYTSTPNPVWRSSIASAKVGERHPSKPGHTGRLERLSVALRDTVVRHLGAEDGTPVFRTELSPENARVLEQLHLNCDWVISLDRNPGVEYFDSPQTDRTTYDTYVIDCVPERHDLACLQLITSTRNVDEVVNLLDSVCDQMGISQSPERTTFLFGHLKALGGHRVIGLSGNILPQCELIALALARANCSVAESSEDCWLALSDGFVVPVDQIEELIPIPILKRNNGGMSTAQQADMIYVSTLPRKGLVFRFIQVKYRRDLRAARASGLLRTIQCQTADLHDAWARWLSHKSHDVSPTFRAVRRARLAQVLRFYADKAWRHELSDERYHEIVSELDRMIIDGASYVLHSNRSLDRGWIFCPEYSGRRPQKLSRDHSDAPQVYLFGPVVRQQSVSRDEATHAQPSDSGVRRRSQDSSNEQDRKTEVSRSESVRIQNGSDMSVAGDTPSIGLGVDTFRKVDVRWFPSVKGNPHLLIAGLPGMGKTTCLLNICNQMLARDICPIVFSYHEDIDDRLEQLVGTVRYVDFEGLGFNPLEVVDRTSRTSYLDVAGAIRDIFRAIFPELGDIQSTRIRRAIKDSFIEVGWSTLESAQSIGEPPFKRFVEILKQEPKPNQGLRRLLDRLEELEDYGFFEVGQSQGSLWSTKEPVVVRVHRTQNDMLQRAFAFLVFYRLYKDMFFRGIQDRVTHAVVLDEAHRAAKLELIPTMAKECRKYGVSLVLASQEARDFNVSVFSAIANYLILRLTDADARALVRNVTNSERERSLIDKIKQIKKFKALFFSEGKTTPFPVDLSPLQIPVE